MSDYVFVGAGIAAIVALVLWALLA
jgi:hypothetical protein